MSRYFDCTSLFTVRLFLNAGGHVTVRYGAKILSTVHSSVEPI